MGQISFGCDHTPFTCDEQCATDKAVMKICAEAAQQPTQLLPAQQPAELSQQIYSESVGAETREKENHQQVLTVDSLVTPQVDSAFSCAPKLNFRRERLPEVLSRYKWDYLHIPKTAGTFVEKAFERSGKLVGNLQWKSVLEPWVRSHCNAQAARNVQQLLHPWHSPPAIFRQHCNGKTPYDGKKLMCTVRDPWERLLSSYQYVCAWNKKCSTSLGDFVAPYPGYLEMLGNQGHPQYTYLADCDYVIRMEDGLEAELTQFMHQSSNVAVSASMGGVPRNSKSERSQVDPSLWSVENMSIQQRRALGQLLLNEYNALPDGCYTPPDFLAQLVGQ